VGCRKKGKELAFIDKGKNGFGGQKIYALAIKEKKTRPWKKDRGWGVAEYRDGHEGDMGKKADFSELFWEGRLFYLCRGENQARTRIMLNRKNKVWGKKRSGSPS